MTKTFLVRLVLIGPWGQLTTPKVAFTTKEAAESFARERQAEIEQYVKCLVVRPDRDGGGTPLLPVQALLAGLGIVQVNHIIDAMETRESDLELVRPKIILPS